MAIVIMKCCLSNTSFTFLHNFPFVLTNHPIIHFPYIMGIPFSFVFPQIFLSFSFYFLLFSYFLSLFLYGGVPFSENVGKRGMFYTP